MTRPWRHPVDNCPDCGGVKLAESARCHVCRYKAMPQPSEAEARRRLLSRLDASDGIWSCWVIDGWHQKHGYGLFQFRGEQKLAHRVAYELFVGPIPDGLHVLHHCDNPPCCNPTHLWLGTHADNMADMARKGRQVGTRGKKFPHRSVAA